MSNIRYPKELRERATRMVLDALEDNPKDRGAVGSAPGLVDSQHVNLDSR